MNTNMSIQKVQVLLAVKALEPFGCGSSLHKFLKSRNVKLSHQAVYRQLAQLKQSKYIRVDRKIGRKEELKTTALGRKGIDRWMRTLERISKI
jgi:Fe2+ or Zn2+ uptake regulation protein